MGLVEQSIDGGTVTLTLNRPDKRNALNEALVADLTAAVERVSKLTEVRVIVLTGAGKSFCAGADLKQLEEMRGQSAEENLEDSGRLADLFLTIARSEVPLIARVNGDALGGGAGLVVSCDWAFMVPEGVIGFPEVRLGFVPAVVLPFLVRQVGCSTARDLVLRGRRLSAAEAEATGLIFREAAADRIDDEVRALTREIARETSRTAVALSRRLLQEAGRLPLEEAVDRAVIANAFARGTADFETGLSAFLSGESPSWQSSRDD